MACAAEALEVGPSRAAAEPSAKEIAHCDEQLPPSFEGVAAALKRDGFALARGVVDGCALRAMAEEYERRCLPLKVEADIRREKHGCEGADGRGRIVHVSNVCEMPELASLAATPALVRLAAACLECEGVRPVLNTELFDKPPRGNASTQTPPHQDNFYFQSPLPGVALWIALDDMGDDTGTVRFVEGSHRRGLRFHDWDWGPYGGFAKQIFDYNDEDDELERQLGHVSPGDVAIHHGLTIHHAPSNLTSTRRRGLVVNYVAEHVANSLADDLYQPALEFHLCEDGHLMASLPPSWPERQALAKVCVECALVGWRGAGGELGKAAVCLDRDVGKLTVRVVDPALMPEAVAALVASGHVVRGLPCPGGASPPGGTVPPEFVGAWAPAAAAPSEVAIRLQASCGAFVELRTSRETEQLSEEDSEDEQLRHLLRWAAAQIAAGGDASALPGSHVAASGDGVVLARRRLLGLHPADGGVDALRCVRVQGASESRQLAETSLRRVAGAAAAEETWQRLEVGDQERASDGGTAALELVDDPEGRHGLWVVAGGWFGVVVGRPSADPLASVACRSLQHALRAYAERWSLEPAEAVGACEAAFGRVEAPGMLRATATLRTPVPQPGAPRVAPGDLVLDLGARQLRRDAADGDVLVESWSGRRWRARELPSGFAALGPLKRSAPQ